jgi:uncharacterized protein YxjI
MNSDFFASNDYFIDEKVNFFKFENCYQVYNDKGEKVGSVNQKLTFWQKALRLLLNKAMLPFTLEIRNLNDEIEATISRGWSFILSKIKITDAAGNPIGRIEQKFKLFKPSFKIYNTQEQLIAHIAGDWKSWNFTISGEAGNQIGTITKKWAGAMKEVFTSADKYNVNIDSHYANKQNKMVILCGAITIDMVLKESK